jgi:hypothetical protein
MQKPMSDGLCGGYSYGDCIYGDFRITEVFSVIKTNVAKN